MRLGGILSSEFSLQTKYVEPTRSYSPRITASVLAELTSQITLAPGGHEALEPPSPYTGMPLAPVPRGREADIEAAVRQARAAQPGWEALPLDRRAAIFLRFHDLVLDRQDEGLDLVQLETGKARRHALEEIIDVANVARYYGTRAADYLRPRRRKGALPLLTRAWEFHPAIGVAGFIVPWNYPLNLAVTDPLPALIAGNAAVLKPDHQTSFTALWALGLLREAGLPREVLTLVTGEGSEIGPALAQSADYIMFTGSTRTGRLVAGYAASRLIGCSLELGGKNPMLALSDADLDSAVDGAVRGCFVGAGQVCVSIERIYVHESIFEQFVERFAARARSLRLGAALDYSMDMGSLMSDRQLRTVEDHVRDAVEKGARVVTGGRPRPDIGPLFYEPTILTGVRPEMKAFSEETFGPVVSVYPFAAESEATERANDTPYGLNASVWTRDTRRGVAVARRIRAGCVNVNEVYAAAWGSVDAPIGGMKDSGIGRRHGAEGILKFTESQTVAVQRLIPVGPPRGMSVETYARWSTRFLRLLRRLS